MDYLFGNVRCGSLRNILLYGIRNGELVCLSRVLRDDVHDFDACFHPFASSSRPCEFSWVIDERVCEGFHFDWCELHQEFVVVAFDLDFIGCLVPLFTDFDVDWDQSSHLPIRVGDTKNLCTFGEHPF